MNNSSDNVAPVMTESSAKPPMGQGEQYLFSSEFDYSETVDDIQSITPKQLAQEREKTKQEAYNDGYQKGIQDTNENIARTAGDQLFVITGKIDELIQSENLILETFHTQVAQVTELVTSKVLPALAQNGALEEVKQLLDQVKSKVPTDQTITVKVHNSLVDPITAHLKNVKTEQGDAQINVISGDNFHPADCEITWSGAGIEHYMHNIMDEVKETLLRLGGESLELSQEKPLPKETSEEESAKEESTDEAGQQQNNSTKENETEA